MNESPNYHMSPALPMTEKESTFFYFLLKNMCKWKIRTRRDIIFQIYDVLSS